MMSINHVYVGPYIRIDIAPKQTAAVDRCKNPTSCPDKAAGNFCSECGIENSTRFDSSYKKHDFSELCERAPLYEADPENHAKENSSHLIPNQYISTPRKFYIYEHESAIVNLDRIDAGVEREWLRRAFWDEIQNLEQEFGQDNISVSWGILKWWK